MYLVIDNGRPVIVSADLKTAKGYAALRADNRDAFWAKSLEAPDDKLYTVSTNGCPRWTGWEVRTIDVF